MTGIVRSRDSVRRFEMPFGSHVLPDGRGTAFRLWAPSAKTVDLMIGDQPHPMRRDEDGWFFLKMPNTGAGTRYQFRIDGDLQVPDPASRFQPQDVHGPSEVVDPASFTWRDTQWHGRPWPETVLYELHVGTFSPQGTFAGVKEKLDYLVDLGITAIELMPLSEFPGRRNWGYDGVMHFAPDRSYGTPDELKDLIQTAHEKGLMVFLDVVYNHFGPEGNYLHAYAKPFFTEHYHTPWGAAIHFEGPRPVRDFFIRNALFWLHEYHFDGLRFDAVHAIYDESERHFLNELAETVRAQIAQTDPERHVHLVLENDDNSARYLSGKQRHGFDAQWNDDFHHAMHVLLSGDDSGYYGDYSHAKSARAASGHLARCLTEGFAYQGEPSSYRNKARRGENSAHLPPAAFVNFLQNHDQIGNRAFGERLISLTSPEAMRAALAVLLLSPSVPMLYMGEEWQTEKPFLFFCDFGADLAPLVTEGRRKEFAQFPQFSDPAIRDRIPDPSTEATFESSRLDWEELRQPSHAAWLNLTRELLAIRHREIIPWLNRLEMEEGIIREMALPGEHGLFARWEPSNGSTLLLAANLGPNPLTFNLAEHHNFKPGHSQLAYQSEDGVFEQWQSGRMPAWSVVWCLQ